MHGELQEERSEGERLRLVVPKEKLLITPHRRPIARLEATTRSRTRARHSFEVRSRGLLDGMCRCQAGDLCNRPKLPEPFLGLWTPRQRMAYFKLRNLRILSGEPSC